MVRGPKKHMKRLNAPKHWMLSKMGGIFAPKPAAGPHKTRECLPLSLVLRNRLKYALTRRESMMILMQKHVKVDGKVRTELNYPTGFMGEIPTWTRVGNDLESRSLPTLRRHRVPLAHPLTPALPASSHPHQTLSRSRRATTSCACCTTRRAASCCTRSRAKRRASSCARW
jgi:hypothetical protein